VKDTPSRLCDLQFLTIGRFNYCSFEHVDMKSYPVVKINTLFDHLNYVLGRLAVFYFNSNFIMNGTQQL